MTATGQIWLDFLDVETIEHRALNRDITTRVTPAGRRLYAQRNTYGPLFGCLYTPQTSSAAKIEHRLRRGGKVVDCQSAKHSEEDHMIPVVTVPGLVNGCTHVFVAHSQVLELTVVVERVDGFG